MAFGKKKEKEKLEDELTPDESFEEENELEDKKSKKKKQKKEKKDKKEKKPKKKKSKVKGFFKFLVLLLLFIATLGAVIYYNVLDIRSKYLEDYLVKVPAIYNLLPPIDDLTSKTKEQLEQEILDLKAEIESLNSSLESEVNKNQIYTEEIVRLEEIESEQLAFKKNKEDFDTMIASGSPVDYTLFYEDIYPETAQRLYASLKEEVVESQELKDYIARFESMDAKKIAPILEGMITTDLKLVVMILENMNISKSGDVLSSMKPDSAGKIVKRMAP